MDTILQESRTLLIEHSNNTSIKQQYFKKEKAITLIYIYLLFGIQAAIKTTF